MSILKSTRAGYKFHYAKEMLLKCCDFYIGDTLLTENQVDAIVNEDGTITVKPYDFGNSMHYMVFTRMLGRGDGPEEWFKNGPWSMLTYIGPSEKYRMVIKQPFDKEFIFKEINANVEIESPIKNIEKYFKNCRINGNVNSSYYTQMFLFNKRICSYFGKEYMGF